MNLDDYGRTFTIINPSWDGRPSKILNVIRHLEQPIYPYLASMPTLINIHLLYKYRSKLSTGFRITQANGKYNIFNNAGKEMTNWLFAGCAPVITPDMTFEDLLQENQKYFLWSQKKNPCL